MKPSWLTQPPKWEYEYQMVFQEGNTSSVPAPNLDTIINNSDRFPISFATDAVRCKSLTSTVHHSALQRNINSTYPLIHEHVLYLCAKFLVFKQQHGSHTEKELYDHMSLIPFIDRLLHKKAVAFAGAHDHYLLLDKSEGFGNWERIGSEDESEPLILKNCLSYDELKLSALISISSYSYFINDGSRKAQGIVENREKIQPEGIVISIVGPRLHKHNAQEYQEIIVTKDSHSENEGPTLRSLFSVFYKEPVFMYGDTIKMNHSENERFIKIHSGSLFDTIVYKKRLIVSFDTLLTEANCRAKQINTSAYVHLVGVGLGVWSISSHQEFIFVDTLAERLSVLGSKLRNVSDINLAYFRQIKKCGKYKNGDTFKVQHHPTGIKIHICNREPFSRLYDTGKLLVVSYAADSNSLPGNEFWWKCLGNSSDSATASSSQISELHNPYINPLVTAKNLMVVTCEGLLIPIQKYASQVNGAK